MVRLTSKSIPSFALAQWTAPVLGVGGKVGVSLPMNSCAVVLPELKESVPFGEPKPVSKEPLPEKPVLAPAAVDKPKEAPEPHPDLPVKLPQEEPTSRSLVGGGR